MIYVTDGLTGDRDPRRYVLHGYPLWTRLVGSGIQIARMWPEVYCASDIFMTSEVYIQLFFFSGILFQWFGIVDHLFQSWDASTAPLMRFNADS